jgi:hypothetical protein
MSDRPNPRRQPDLYWKQLAQLKAASICIRLYRNQLAQRVRAVEIVNAVGSSGAIAGWVVWRAWPLLWAGIIAAAQFLDATKHVFPDARLHRSASALTVALELRCIAAETEGEAIFPGKVSDEGVVERRARLMKVRLEAEHQHFPDGFVPERRLIALANRQARDYIRVMYGEDQNHVQHF